MKRKMVFSIKSLLVFLSIMALVVVTIACQSPKEQSPVTGNPMELETDELKATAFEKNVDYLRQRGLELPDLQPNSSMGMEMFFTLLVEAYESLGTEIDISMVNPKYEVSEAVKKMSLIGVYDNFFGIADAESSDVDYGSVANWLMKLQDSIQNRLYARADRAATTYDLLLRINTSTSLHTWTEDDKETSTYVLGDLVAGDVASDQQLTRLIVAEMLVSAYEAVLGEIDIAQKPKPKDTEDIHAWKSNELFFWSESGDFEPELTGNWDDWSFMSAIIYDAQLRVNMNLDESKAPYGSVVAALATLLKSNEGLEQQVVEEKIVLNERPYDWHVYQQDTGEYSNVNCMPSTVEMALRYQGISDIPSAETLRNENLWNGLGWTDMVAEHAMQQYGLSFTDSFDVTLDLEKMLDQLDGGNILYVMYRELDNPEGHSALIKGYWKQGERVHFIVADPNYNFMGPFGYLEYIKDAQTMVLDIERHLTRYFIIPPGE